MFTSMGRIRANITQEHTVNVTASIIVITIQHEMHSQAYII